MKKLFIVLSIGVFASCQNTINHETSNVDTTEATAAIKEAKDTASQNTGAWFANVKPDKAAKGYVLTVSGVITPVDAKAKPTLSKNSTSGSETELALNLSHEPKPVNEKQISTVTYTEKSSDITKYKRVIVFFNGKLIASLDNIEHIQ